MLNLSELVFKVNTEALVDAANKVAALGKSVDGLSSTFSKLEKSSSQASKAQAKAEKDLAAAEVDRAKAAEIAAKTEERKAKAIRDTAQATEDATKATKNHVSILERQRDINTFVAQGFTQGQASTMASAKAAGALADELRELGTVMKDTRSLIGGNTFDKSLNGLEALRNEYKVLTRVQSMMVSGMDLTQKQMKELALDEIRLTAAMKTQGKTATETATAIAKLNKDYLQTAGGVNAVTKAEKELADMHREAASANTFLEKEMQRVNFALQAQNNELNKGTANALNRFEQNLKRSGLTLDQQRVKLEEYRKGLLALEKTKGGNTDYITRALGPQITDIFVGLATGQAPLTVMLQQGGQLRDQFALAGVAAADMGKTMRTAAKDMVVSVAAVARAFGDLLLGAVIDTGKGITDLTMRMTGLNAVFESARNRLLASGGLMGITPTSVRALDGFKSFVSFLVGGSLALGVTALIALGVAFSNAIKEGAELNRNLELTGASLGLTKSAALDLAQSLATSERPVAKVVEVITQLAKAGEFSSSTIGLVTNAAIDLERYGKVSIEATAKELAKLKEDPVKALLDVAEKMGYVDVETIKSVKSLREQGRMADAATLAMTAWANSASSAASSIKAQMSPLEQVWDSMLLKINKVVGAIQDIVRGSGIAAQIADKETQLADVRSGFFTSTFGLSPKGRKDIDRLSEEIYLLKLQLQVETDVTKEREKRSSNAAQLKAEEAAVKDYTNALDRQEIKEVKLNDFVKKAIVQRTKDIASALGKNIEDVKVSAETIAKITEGATAQWKSAQPKAKKDPADNFYANTLKQAKDELIKVQGATESLTQSEIFRLEVLSNPKFKALSSDRQKEITSIMDQAAAVSVQTQVEQLRERIMGQTNMLGKDYYKTLDQINDLVNKKDGLGVEEAQQLVKALSDATPFAKAMTDWYYKMHQAIAQSNEETKNALGQLAIENSELDYRLSLFGQTDAEQKKITIEYERQKQLAKALLDYEKKRNDILNKKEFGSDEARNVALQNALSVYDATLDNINKNAAVRYAEDMMAEFQRISNGITDSIVTALFEGGKAGSKKLRDLIMSELRKPVTIVVQAVVNTLLGSVIGSVAGSAAGSTGSGIIGSIATSLGGNAISSGLGLSGLFAGATTAASNAALATSLGLGSASATAAATGAAVAGGASTGIAGAASSFGSALATIPGWGWAIAGIAALAGLMSKKATPHAGAGSTFSATSGLQNINLGAANNMGFMANYAKETQGLTDQIAKTLVGALDSTAKSFGTTAGYAVSAAFADDTSKDGAWGQLIIKKLGVGDIVNWGLEAAVGKWAPKEFADGAEGQQQYMNAIAKSARDALKSAIGDVRWAQNMLDALGDSPTIEQLSATVDQINQAQTAIGELGKNIKGFASLTNDAISSLVEASGGAQAFFANMQSFYDSFYSDAEKTANQSRDIADALAKVGLAMPATRDEYRKMVEQQLALGESGSKAAATLLQYSSAFANITQSQQDLVQAEQDRLDAAIEAYKTQQRDFLNIQIDAVSKQVDSFQKLFDFLDDQIKKLYGSVESTAKMQLTQAYAVINGAVSSKQLPDQAVLEDAVGTITGSMQNGNYASKVDADRDRLRFAAQLDDLRNLAGDNLKSAKNTFDLLKLQLAALEDQKFYVKQQVGQLYTLDDSVQSVENAIRQMSIDVQQSIYTGFSSGAKPAGNTGGSGGSYGGGVGSSINRGYQSITPKVNYSSDEALTSFDKFNDWYKGQTYNAKFAAEYQKPDWMTGLGLSTTDDNLFKAYLFFKNNPQFAKDYENITNGGLSTMSTDSTSLIRSDLSKMPTDVADYFKKNPYTLLSYEGFGLDPVLAYKMYKEGPGGYVDDFRNVNLTEWLRTHKWTENGVIDFDNQQYMSTLGYKGMNATRWDTSTGTLVDMDGTIYTPNGDKVGKASKEQMIALYGEAFVVGSGAQYGDKTSSSLYDQNISAGMSEAEYYATLRQNLDTAINSGWSAQQIVDAMRQTGASLQDVATAYGVTPAEISQNLANGGATNIPTFAKGGAYTGGTALVGEKGPELINFNSGGYIHTASESRSMLNQSEVVQELVRLNNKIEMVEAAARSTAVTNNKMAKLLDRLSPDGDALQVKTVEGSVTTVV